MLSCINVIAISRCDFPASTTSSILARRRRGIIEFPPNGTSNSVPNPLRVPIALLSCKYFRIPTNPRIELSWNNSQYLMEQNLFAFCTFNKQFIRSRYDPLVWLSCRSVGRPGWPWQYCTPPAYLSRALIQFNDKRRVRKRNLYWNPITVQAYLPLKSVHPPSDNDSSTNITGIINTTNPTKYSIWQ